ncbi:MAG: N-acetylmuramoyl-L-alanine amidase [Alphaproteobacteria bacterium]
MTEKPLLPNRRLFLRCALGCAALGISVSVPTSLFSAEIKKPGRKKRFPMQSGAAASPPKLLMIDPGHGGRDPGAIGAAGTYEKDITLDISRRMAQHLAGKPRLNASLTRDMDEFMPLADRVEKGRQTKADFFVSVHADSASNREARGFSAYTLSDQATDDFSKALAQQENLADRIGGVNLDGTDQEVAGILLDLEARRSRDVAQRAKVDLVRGVGKEWRLLNNPLRAANFAVLRAPDIPSILVETGFLSNKKDEAILRQPAQREKIAKLLANELARIMAVSANG